MEETNPLPRTSGTGTKQQPRGKLYARCSPGSQKLDPHRQPTSRTACGRHPLGGGKLPPAPHPCPRIPERDPARTCQQVHSGSRRHYASQVGRKTLTLICKLASLTASTVCLAVRIRSISRQLPRLHEAK